MSQSGRIDPTNEVIAELDGPIPGQIPVRVVVTARSVYQTGGTSLRALVETIGDVDAITIFRQQMPSGSASDEAEVLRFIRLLSLLATDGKSAIKKQRSHL